MEKVERKIKIYFSHFSIRFLNIIQYRMTAISGLITQICWGAMYIMLYSTFLKNGDSSNMTIAQMSTYIWLQQSGYILFNSWAVEKEIIESIQTGSIAMELVRPIDLYESWHSKIAGKKIANWILRAFPLLLICYILPLGQYGFKLPANSTAFILFVITFVLSFLLIMAYVMIMYISAMYTIGTNRNKDYVSACKRVF